MWNIADTLNLLTFPKPGRSVEKDVDEPELTFMVVGGVTVKETPESISCF